MTDMADNPAQPRAAHRRQLRGASRYLQFETWEAGIVLVGTEIKATCASVVHQVDGALSRVSLARMIFARMSDAVLVQMNGFGWSLW